MAHEEKGTRPTDEELIERFQNGDLYAFDLIVKRYKNQLLNKGRACPEGCRRGLAG